MSNLSKEAKEIKLFCKYGLLSYTNHCDFRINQRLLDKDEIIEVIKKRDFTIIQNHEPGTYNNNKDELFVLYSKFKFKGKSKPLHIVIAKEITKNQGINYKIVTSYIPSNNYFFAYGRKLRRH